MAEKKALVAVIMGSESDREIAMEAVEVLEGSNIPHEVKVFSAHRNSKELEKYISESESEIFIAIAGLAAHLPGFIASRTEKPVIGVPVSSKLGGLDALLSIVQMPSGVPVACVGIDNARNAAFLALRILKLLGY